MLKGSTIIFNTDYIAELERHQNNTKERLDNEIDPETRKELEDKYNYFTAKLERAMDFQDTIEEIINVEIPSIATVKTLSGVVIPLKNVQVI